MSKKKRKPKGSVEVDRLEPGFIKVARGSRMGDVIEAYASLEAVYLKAKDEHDESPKRKAWESSEPVFLRASTALLAAETALYRLHQRMQAEMQRILCRRPEGCGKFELCGPIGNGVVRACPWKRREERGPDNERGRRAGAI